MSLTPSPEAPESFLAIVERWSPAIEAEVELSDVETLAAIHLDLSHVKRHVSDLAALVEQRLAEVMPEKRLELPGMPIMERRIGTKRTKWDVEKLAPKVAQVALVDPDTGEIPASPMQAVELVTAAFMGAFPITPSCGVRVTYLRSIDLDPDEWSESAPGRVSVQIHEVPQ